MELSTEEKRYVKELLTTEAIKASRRAARQFLENSDAPVGLNIHYLETLLFSAKTSLIIADKLEI